MYSFFFQVSDEWDQLVGWLKFMAVETVSKALQTDIWCCVVDMAYVYGMVFGQSGLCTFDCDEGISPHSKWDINGARFDDRMILKLIEHRGQGLAILLRIPNVLELHFGLDTGSPNRYGMISVGPSCTLISFVLELHK